jgi:hypothetical protein
MHWEDRKQQRLHVAVRLRARRESQPTEKDAGAILGVGESVAADVGVA